MGSVLISTPEKALALNLDDSKFGVFAEIGAGQEVARWFFHVGRASHTVGKSISAYDMAISDDLYGPTHHYVSRERLEAMLNHEWDQLIERLDPIRGEKTRFFVFADTVATRSQARHADGHGWIGVRFQAEPRAPFSEIIIHAVLLDRVSAAEQEALGILGVNLLHGAFYRRDSQEMFLQALIDGLTRDRVDIDMIKFAGPAFQRVDNRLMSLQLVESGLTDAAMFTAEGEVVQPAELLWQKPVVIERGSFRPATNITLDMLDRACDRFRQLAPDPVVVMEMTLSNLLTEGTGTHEDFLARADILGALGKTVMISNYTRFDRVTDYLRHYTQNWIGMVLGVPTLREIFEEKYYEDLEGGILEGLGRLFRGSVRLYVYPTLLESGGIATSANVEIPQRLQHLLEYVRDNGGIEPLEDFDAQQLHIFPRDVLSQIQSGTPGWEQYVPAQAAALIKQRALFGYGAGG